MIIKSKAHPRAGLVGNPSDGYHGKTIAVILRNFTAEVALYESPELEILPNVRDHSCFNSIAALAEDVRQHGYYGGLRLLKATIKRFYNFCQEQNITLHQRNFTIRYHSNIPTQVGLAGSSAIITACLRALMQFYDVTIPKPIQPNLILSVENNELKIPAGLQDRVVQTYEGLVYMDFAKELFDKQGHGDYEELNPNLLPPLYVAYRGQLAEGTEVFHNDIRSRFNRGEPEVVNAMKYWADLTEQVKALLLGHQPDKIGALMDKSFDKRKEIYRIGEGNLRMVEMARSVGASATFTGSGGAIVGVYKDDDMYQRLVWRLSEIGVKVFKPIIVET
jgi:glucuronokinase